MNDKEKIEAGRKESLRRMAMKYRVEQSMTALYPHKIDNAYIAGYEQAVNDLAEYIEFCSLGHGNYSIGKITVDSVRPYGYEESLEE